MTCLPGLMDMHVHLLSETGPENYANQFRLDPADYAFASVKFAQRTLMAGFTLVRDLGSSDNLAISLRNAIARGDITGPRVLAAGKSLATTGGHADPTNGRNRILRGDPGPAEGVVNGVRNLELKYGFIVRLLRGTVECVWSISASLMCILTIGT